MHGAVVAGMVLGLAMLAGASSAGAAGRVVAADNPALLLAPYVWKLSGAGGTARAEATMPGAYLKAVVARTGSVGLVIDGDTNRGCRPSTMPVVEWTVDDGPFQVQQLSQTEGVYTLPLAAGLDGDKAHTVQVFFRASGLGESRWTKPTAHLRIAGLALDEGGSLTPCPARPKRAIGFGDSITEGVGVDAHFTSWEVLGPNNARGAWLGIVCAALDCEYGQLGSGGHGMVRTLEMPPLPQTWDHYDATASRLTDGRLEPEPDYVFCNLGTNDFGGLNITGAYTGWLAAMRKACPHARMFCVVPPSGVHRDEIQAAVAARKKARDARVHLIDTPELNSAIRAQAGATQMTYDGAHPTQYGNAMFAAAVVARVQAVLGR